MGGILSFERSPSEVLILIAMFRYSCTIKIHKYCVFIIVPTSIGSIREDIVERWLDLLPTMAK